MTSMEPSEVAWWAYDRILQYSQSLCRLCRTYLCISIRTAMDKQQQSTRCWHQLVQVTSKSHDIKNLSLKNGYEV